jgi:preprotein translocase subunit SecG
MFTFMIFLEVVICLVLMLVILMQSSKGGGLAGTFGGGSVGMMFGVRRTADFLIRATQILSASFIILALVINIFFLPRGNAGVESVIQRGTPARSVTTPQLPPSEPAPITTPPAGGK